MPSDSERLLICSPGIPHPSRGASTVLFYQYIERLKREGFRILNLLLLQPSNHDEQGLAAYRARLEDEDRFRVLPCHAQTFTVSSRRDIRLDTAAVAPALGQAQAFDPELILAFDLLAAWVAAGVDASVKVAWLGDLNFQTEWYHAWYAARERPSRALRLPRVWNRMRIWKRVYARVLARMDVVITASASSVPALRGLGIAACYHPYPWPATPPIVAEAGTASVKPAKPVFLFCGNLAGLGSRSAFHFLVRRLYPRLVDRWGRGGFELLVAGDHRLPGWVQQAFRERPEFTYRGFVDDIGRLMASCHAVLVPIAVPVGNRSRIVTAMAQGALVIAHRNASLGNPDLVDGLTCYLAADAATFVERMERAVRDPEQSAAIVARARHCYQTRFQPEAAGGLLVAALRKARQTASRTDQPPRAAWTG